MNSSAVSTAKRVFTHNVFNSRNPEGCGIVEVDMQGIVTSFHEKVQNPPGNRANGAIYVFDSEFVEILSSLKTPPSDFSTQVLPEIIGKIFTHHTTTNFIDIGTPDNLRAAQTIWN